MEINIKVFGIAFVIILTIASIHSAMAETHKVNGHIVDENGIPIQNTRPILLGCDYNGDVYPNATLREVLYSGNNTMTDDNGNFQFEINVDTFHFNTFDSKNRFFIAFTNDSHHYSSEFYLKPGNTTKLNLVANPFNAKLYLKYPSQENVTLEIYEGVDYHYIYDDIVISVQGILYDDNISHGLNGRNITYIFNGTEGTSITDWDGSFSYRFNRPIIEGEYPLIVKYNNITIKQINITMENPNYSIPLDIPIISIFFALAFSMAVHKNKRKNKE